MTDRIIDPDLANRLFLKGIAEFVPEEPGMGPQPYLVVLTDDGSAFQGPVFGNFDDPLQAIQHLHPAMLPGTGKIIQVVFIVEADGLYGPDPENLVRTDIALLFAAAHPDTPLGTWRAFSPFTRLFPEPGKAEVIWSTQADPTPPVWHEFEAGESLDEEPLLQALRRFVTTDRLDPIDPTISIQTMEINHREGESLIQWEPRKEADDE